jgi:nitroreductase
MSHSSHPKAANVDHDVHELIRRRWSPRAFDPARDIPHDELLRLFEAARWAPSSANEQPWRFVVVRRSESNPVWAALIESLNAGNQAWAPSAPVLVVGAVRLSLERNETPNPAALYDMGQAVGLLTVQATSQELSLRQMEGFDRERARQAVSIPAGFDPVVIIAIGYAGDPGSLALERHREAERTPRKRKPIGEFVYEDGWGRRIG